MSIDSRTADDSLLPRSPVLRICQSHGHANIFTLAKNAGTSVDQIERFYAKHLPMVPALWRNLQSFGEA
jgi:hypothetical protein